MRRISGGNPHFWAYGENPGIRRISVEFPMYIRFTDYRMLCCETLSECRFTIRSLQELEMKKQYPKIKLAFFFAFLIIWNVIFKGWKIICSIYIYIYIYHVLVPPLISFSVDQLFLALTNSAAPTQSQLSSKPKYQF